MYTVIDIFLLVLNLVFGFHAIATGANPYLIAFSFFAAGIIAKSAIETALR